MIFHPALNQFSVSKQNRAREIYSPARAFDLRIDIFLHKRNVALFN